MPALPNFFIIGAAKSGTTALYSYLRQHPDVFMSPLKEPRFFAHKDSPPDWRGPGDDAYVAATVTSFAAYLSLFHEAAAERAVGEASTQYLYLPAARSNIKRYVPRARLVAILRDPAEVAFAAYLHKRREGNETITDFRRALDAEPGRVRDGWSPIWHYRRRGFYYEHLAAYYREFDASQIRVYLHDDLKADPRSLVRDLFGFLGVDDSFAPDLSSRPNRSGVPRSRTLQRLLARPNAAREALRRLLPEPAFRRALEAAARWNLSRPRLPEEARAHLIEGYREDILRLQDLLRRDLSAWLRPTRPRLTPPRPRPSDSAARAVGGEAEAEDLAVGREGDVEGVAAEAHDAPAVEDDGAGAPRGLGRRGAAPAPRGLGGRGAAPAPGERDPRERLAGEGEE